MIPALPPQGQPARGRNQKTSLRLLKHRLVLFSQLQKLIRRDLKGISYGKEQIE